MFMFIVMFIDMFIYSLCLYTVGPCLEFYIQHYVYIYVNSKLLILSIPHPLCNHKFVSMSMSLLLLCK